MAKAYTISQMVIYTVVNGLKTLYMVMVNDLLLMGVCTKVNGFKVASTVMVKLHKPMAVFMKDNGRKELSLGREL